MSLFNRFILTILLPLTLIMAVELSMAGAEDVISLPSPAFKSGVSVEEALKNRRTCRAFKAEALTLNQLSQVLWAAYGVTGRIGALSLKTAPSAGALYPLEIYAIVGEGGVNDLAAGVYHYLYEPHGLRRIATGDQRKEAASAASNQMWMARAPVLIAVAGQYAKATVKYGERGIAYTHIEAGCVSQNIFLQAEASGLKAGIVGAFDNKRIQKALNLPPEAEPQVIMPVGHPR